MREVDAREFAVATAATPDVVDALGRLGRTEDVRIAPRNDRLVLAAFDRELLAVVDFTITVDGGHPQVQVSHVDELRSPRLHLPHGVDFLDDATLLVANCTGDLAVLHLPCDREAAGASGRLTAFDPSPAHGFELVGAPSSVLVDHQRDDVDVLVCYNADHAVSRHRVRMSAPDPPMVTRNDVLLRYGLVVPDSAAVSRDGHWLAVSNHGRHVVMLYERSSPLDESSRPQGILRGLTYPHGARFTADGRHLFVADAGRPYVHVFAQRGVSWAGVHHPTLSLRVMDDETFARGHRNPQEGGPKGIDLDRSGRVLVLTCECVPLAWFDVDPIMERCADTAPDETDVAYELGAMEEAEAELRIAEARLASVKQSRVLQMTAPLRDRYTRWRRRNN
ncbi:MAG: YncE family protein [Acidimicrobiia bacterium]